MNLDRQTVGVVGLGLLGSAICRRLLDAAFPVVGFDLNPICSDRLLTQGGIPCSDASAVVEAASTIVLSLPDSTRTQQVLREVASDLKRGHTIVDTTTGDPDALTHIAAELADRGIGYIEANVAGSSAQLATGEAPLLLGGAVAYIDGCRGVLNALSSRQFHVGEAGCGMRFKLVHNLILGLHRAVLAEGLAFAESLGFDPAVTLDILRQTPAASQVMASKGDKMVQRDYEPQAKLSQHLKDVRLILEQADDARAKTPLSLVHRELLERAEALGYGELDNSAVREAYRHAPEDPPK